MINLIPSSAKRNITIEYWIRVATVWVWLLSIVLVISLLLLLPLHVLINAQITAYRDSANAAIEKIATFENVSLELARATTQAQLIMSSDQKESLSELVYMFRALEGQGVVLTNITMRRADASVASVSITGSAVDRKSLSDFRDRLLEHSRIDTVDFPISNLARDKDIDFSMTVTLTKSTTP